MATGTSMEMADEAKAQAKTAELARMRGILFNKSL